MKIKSLINRLRLPLFSLGVFFCFGASSILADDGDTLSTATPITPGTVTANLTAGDVDWFEFTVTQTGRVAIYSQGFLDTSGAIYDRGGEQIYHNDQGGHQDNFFLSVQLMPETYYIRVKTGQFFGPRTGDYTLTLLTQESAPLITESSFSGELTLGSADFYRIPVEQVGVFEIYTTGTTDTYGSLFNEVGTSVSGMSNENGGADTNFHLFMERFQPGDYLLMISGGGAYSFSPPAAGPYEAFILRPELAEELTETPMDRNLDPLGKVEHFTFEVPEYGEVRFWTTGTTDTWCRLYDSVGVSISGTSGNNSAGGYNFDVKTTLQPGRYYLRVASDDRGNPVGPYRIHLDLPGEVVIPPEKDETTETRPYTPSSRYALSVEIRKVTKALKKAKKKGKKAKAKGLKRVLSGMKRQLLAY